MPILTTERLLVKFLSCTDPNGHNKKVGAVFRKDVFWNDLVQTHKNMIY
jgi:hypothetical protein